MKQKLINLISEEELKRAVSLFGQETVWQHLCKDVSTENHSPKVLLRWEYAKMFANKFFRLNEIVRLNIAKPGDRYFSWLSYDNSSVKFYDGEKKVYFETDVFLFLKDIGSYEWKRRVTKVFNSNDFIKNVIKEIEENDVYYITTHTGDIDLELASKWRESHLFNESHMMKMMEIADFDLKYNPITLKFSLEDKQYANLGNIEDEVFDSVTEAFERMSTYFTDLFDEEEK